MADIERLEQFTSTITIGEMIYGAFKSDRPDYFIEKLDRLLLPNLTILPFDEKAARKYGPLRASLEKAGAPLSEPDLRIASICLVNILTLITANIKHFSKISDLKIESWL